MVGESGTSATNGVKHYYYKCGGAKRKLGCKRRAVKKRWIERAAVIATIERVLRDDEIDRIADAIIDLQNREDTTLPALRQQLKDCEQGIENMLNAIQMGILTPSTKTRLEELESQRESLKVSILQAELESPSTPRNRSSVGSTDSSTETWMTSSTSGRSSTPSSMPSTSMTTSWFSPTTSKTAQKPFL